MIKSKGIFAVSFIAMMVVGGAYANIASQGYVDQQVDAKQNASTAVKVAAAGTAVGDATHPVYVNASGVATKIDKVAAAATADTATTATTATNATKATQDASGNVITTTYATKTELNAKADAEDIPTVNDATLTIQKNGTAVATFTANSATGATANITVPTKTSELNNDSGFITAASLPGEYELKPATADALGGVKSGGDITVGTDGTVTVNGKLSSISGSTGGTGNVVTSVSASGSTVTATKSITAEETKNKVTTVRSKDSATDTAYPSEKAVATALEDKADKSELSDYAINTRVDAVEDKADAAQTAAETAQSAANAKVATAQGSGNANKAVITNSSGNITTGTISSGMIADDAVTAAKIATGAVGTDGLAANAVTTAKIADGTIVNADISASAAIAASKISGLATVATSGSYDDLTDKPTIPAAITVDSALSSTSTNPVQNKAVNAAIDAAQSTADDAADAASAAQSAINNLDVSTASGSGNVVTSVTQSNGKISVTKGNVQIPVGSATATTSYATIWVQ